MEEQLQPGAIKADRMTVSLRKANALQETILETIRGIQLENTITLTEFDDVDVKLDDAQAKLIKNLDRIDRLYAAYYGIRTEVGQANSQGISAKLATIAQYEKVIGVLSNQANTSPRTDINVIKGKLTKIANSSNDQSSLYGRRDEIGTSILTEEMIDVIKARITDLKNTKRKLQDSLLEDNINIKIALPQDIVNTLNAEKLI